MGVTLDKLPLAEMQKIEPAITKDVFKVLSLGSLREFAHEPGRHRARRGCKEQIGILAERLK